MDAAALQASTLAPGDTPSAALALVQPVFADPTLRQALHHLFALAHDAEALALDEAWASVCGQLLGRHAGLAASPPAASPALHQVRERLADDLSRTPTLAELASLAGLSRFQMLRHFTDAYGLPPHAWLRQQRVLRARALIASGLGLAEAAASCGFADQSHMTRSFVQQFGFTPGAWQHATLQ